MEGKWKLHDQNSNKIIFLILRFMVICSSKKKVFGYFLYGFLSLIFLFWSTKFNIIFKIVTLSISITYRLLSRGVHMIKKKKKKVGVSTGRSGSSLCPTRNRPTHIGWEVERLAADCRQSRVESDRAPLDNGWVSRSWSEFQPPDLCRIFAKNR